MTIDVEGALRTAMRGYTADVVPAPTLVDQVRRGGARRRRRAALGLAATPVLVVAVVLAGVVGLPRLRAGSDAAALDRLPGPDRALLARSTQGDLAGDDSYLWLAEDAWRRSHRISPNADRGIFDHLLGAPTVLWAGRTAVGPAAIVAQAADLREHEDIQLDHEGPALLWGFVGPAGNDVQVVADAYPVPGAPTTEAAFIGAERTVLLVLDRGQPLEVSFGRTYWPDGRVDQGWQPVRFPAAGVAVVNLPADTAPTSVALRAAGSPRLVGIGNVTDRPLGSTPSVDRRLPWADPDGNRPVWQVGADPALAWGGQLPDSGAAEEQLLAELDGRSPGWNTAVTMTLLGQWYVVGRTPDGSRLVAGELALDYDPSYAYAALRSPAGRVEIAAGRVQPARPLPVRLRLPRGQGWLVAQRNADLRYRTGDGPTWQPAGRNAALLPPDAVLVQVVRSDGVEVVLL